MSGAEGEAHEVQGVPMLVVAVLGLLANVAAMLVLRGGAKDSINLRGAYLEVLGDLIGSALVIIAAVVIVTTGFDAADPIASIAIAVLIVPRAVTLLRDVMHVLFESAPADTDVAEIREHLLGTPGVVAVHDVHVWQITSGSPVFSAHVEVEPVGLRVRRHGCPARRARRMSRRPLRRRALDVPARAGGPRRTGAAAASVTGVTR